MDRSGSAGRPSESDQINTSQSAVDLAITLSVLSVDATVSRWDLRMGLPRMKETLFSCGSDAFICNNDLFLSLLLFAPLTRP